MCPSTHYGRFCNLFSLAVLNVLSVQKLAHLLLCKSEQLNWLLNTVTVCTACMYVPVCISAYSQMMQINVLSVIVK